MTQNTPKRALVTGASSGIGRAFAVDLARRGVELVVVARDGERLGALAEEISAAHGSDTEVIVADLEDREKLAEVEARLGAEPHCDLVVNNAGYGVTSAFDRTDVARQQGQIDLNITALTRLSHAALCSLRERGAGGVINVASCAAFMSTPNVATYSATKSYVVALSEALHEEAKAYGVTVTVVCPGFTKTEFQQRADYNTKGIPAMAWQSAEDVVEETMTGYLAGASLVIPGMQNRLLMRALSLVPRSIVPGLASRFG